MHLVVPAGGSYRETRRIELGPRVLTIGRSEASDVHLDVPGVDDEHARISEVALIAIGADCAIGDVPLEAGSRRLVMPGDEIQIGSVVLALEGNDPSLVPPPPGGLLRSRSPKVRVVEGYDFGHQLTLEEENRLYVIGRAPSCDLVLEDREVSREHVKLVRRGYSVFIQDQSSTRGSWLGRTSVYAGGAIEWTRPRMLKVGATVLALELPEEIRRNGPPPQASAGMTPAPRAPLAQAEPPSAPGSSEGSAPGPQSSAAHAPAPVSSASPVALPIPSSPPPRPGGSTRKAWKKSGPTIGKASGLLLLALAALTILGALFVVFSLME